MHIRPSFLALTLIMIASVPLAQAGSLHDVADILESEGGWIGRTKDGQECLFHAKIEGGLFGRLVISLKNNKNRISDSIDSADDLYNFKLDSTKIHLHSIDRDSYSNTGRQFDIKLSNYLPISVKAEFNETDRTNGESKNAVVDCLNLKRAN